MQFRHCFGTASFVCFHFRCCSPTLCHKFSLTALEPHGLCHYTFGDSARKGINIYNEMIDVTAFICPRLKSCVSLNPVKEINESVSHKLSVVQWQWRQIIFGNVLITEQQIRKQASTVQRKKKIKSNRIWERLEDDTSAIRLGGNTQCFFLCFSSNWLRHSVCCNLWHIKGGYLWKLFEVGQHAVRAAWGHD